MLTRVGVMDNGNSVHFSKRILFLKVQVKQKLLGAIDFVSNLGKTDRCRTSE